MHLSPTTSRQASARIESDSADVSIVSSEVVGAVAFLMMISVRDVADYEAFTRKLFFENRNVKRFETLVVMSCAKFDRSVRASLALEG